MQMVDIVKIVQQDIKTRMHKNSARLLWVSTDKHTKMSFRKVIVNNVLEAK